MKQRRATVDQRAGRDRVEGIDYDIKVAAGTIACPSEEQSIRTVISQ
jgi:hypothetical protein